LLDSVPRLKYTWQALFRHQGTQIKPI
jgi:hypothetical protein